MSEDWQFERLFVVIAVVVSLGVSVGAGIVAYRLSEEVAALNTRLEMNFTTLKTENAVTAARVTVIQREKRP